MNVATMKWLVVFVSILYNCDFVRGKVYEKCELARELRKVHKLSVADVNFWVCLAEKRANFDTSNSSVLEGSHDSFGPPDKEYGLFRIPGDWCAYNICPEKDCKQKYSDENIFDDLHCAKINYDTKAEDAGYKNRFTDWHEPDCEEMSLEYTTSCFSSTGKIYEKCELAQELRYVHNETLENVNLLVCLAEYRKNFDTAFKEATGHSRLQYFFIYGLFHIRTEWCDPVLPNHVKGCPTCDELQDSDISDDLECAKQIYGNQGQVGSDKFAASHGYLFAHKCKHIPLSYTSSCFQTDDKLKHCGKKLVNHEALITNGYQTQEGDWPWHAAIYHFESFDPKYKCGGTLISSNAVLTAAHCLDEEGSQIIAERVLVKLGKHNLLRSTLNSQEIIAFRIIVHEQFNRYDLSNDIALIRLGTEAMFTKYVTPVCMWEADKSQIDTVVHRNGVVVGWGLSEHGNLPNILSQATMPVVSISECLTSNRDTFGQFLSDNNYCAGFRNGTSVCNGDSGGGMYFLENNTYHIRGIVSLAVAKNPEGRCNPYQYVVFTDVAKYLDWIENKL